MTYDELKAKIEECGCHAELGPSGLRDWGIEQNPHELATLLTAVEPIKSFLEIGTGYRAGLARFMVELGIQVTSLDGVPYGHVVPGACLLVLPPGQPHWTSAQRFDLVLLDGPKDYKDLKAAYEHYKDYGKVIAIHDIAGRRGCKGVYDFWTELSRYKNGRRKPRFHEMVANGSQSAGLGWEIRKK